MSLLTHNGNVYAGSFNTSKIFYSSDPLSYWDEFVDLETEFPYFTVSNVLSLAGKNNEIYVGTSPDGRVLKYSNGEWTDTGLEGVESVFDILVTDNTIY